MSSRDTMPERQAYLCLNSYAGRSEQAVLVIGETPKKYRIKAVMRTKIGGRNLWLYAGESALVPKTAIKFTEVTA